MRLAARKRHRITESVAASPTPDDSPPAERAYACLAHRLRIEEVFMDLSLDNSALLSHDVLDDACRLFDSSTEATPAELHALNSLVEAAVLHDKLYVYEWPAQTVQLGPLEDLFKWNLIRKEPVAEECEAALAAMGLSELSHDVLADRSDGGLSITYKSDRLAEFLQMLVEYERDFGFDQMSSLLDEDDETEERAFKAAATKNFSPKDVLGFDGWYRKARALGTSATELGLHPYTGLITRPLLLDYVSARRRGALAVFEKLKAELDDFDDSDIPEWRRIDIPAMTQQVIAGCKGDTSAIPNEIMRVRTRLADFRATLTSSARAIRQAKTRSEKRRLRKDAEASWEAILQKVDKTTRLSHTMWDVFKNPLAAPAKAGDKLVEKDQLNQAIDKTFGLSDLWALISTAPAMEGNARLLQGLFGTRYDLKQWHAARSTSQLLEDVMRRRATPVLPQA
jgi:Mg2+ and Co2+ transporter CorA